MAFYGITLTQLAKYTAMISTARNEEFTVINQGGFYKRACTTQDFEQLFGEDITINNIEVIDYPAWKMGFHEVQRSSTPLFGSRDTELLVVPFEKQNAALLMLMGHVSIEENISINVNKSAKAIDYSEWKMRIQEVQRSSTPLFGSEESDMLLVPFEREDAALLMLMGWKITEAENYF